MDFADLKVSIPNALTGALMTMVVFLILKWLFVGRIYVPGWSEAVGAL